MITDYISRLKEGKQPLRKEIQKLGTLIEGVVESTPIVYGGRLLRLEWVRPASWGEGHDDRAEGFFRLVDMESEETVGVPFGHAHAFGCAYEESDTLYAYGVRGNDGATNTVDVIWSNDLINWQTETAITLPEELSVYNTSVCKSPDGYVMAIEVDGPEETVGKRYTIIFAISEDGRHFSLLDPEDHIYLKERYTACPSIRYANGYYYMIYLERLPYTRWAPYIVRSRDLSLFEPGLTNPFMMFDDGDKQVLCPENFDEDGLSRMREAVNCNLSDVDLCEYGGRTVILYSWGNQHGKEYLARAEYDGPLTELLQSFFE